MTMANDILADLERWRGHLRTAKSAGPPEGEMPGFELQLLTRAIEEIRGLREREGAGHPEPASIANEELNASNDE